MCSCLSSQDLAGEVCYQPTLFQIKNRVNYIARQYLNSELLCDRLEDLPLQFINPKPRSWQNIDWHNINQSQIINLDLSVFLAIIKGSLDTEAPIRDYTQTSRQYLETIHPQMAQFVGGKAREDNKMIELITKTPGLWIPAENSRGEKVDQELVLSFGMVGC